MDKLRRILVVVDRAEHSLQDLRKGVDLARRCGGEIELFLCEAQQAYLLDHRYDRDGVERVRADCIAGALAYLRELRRSAGAGSVEIAVDATCESPLYAGIVRKVLDGRPDLVIKRAACPDTPGYASVDANDWQLMRTCPATLMLTRGRAWQTPPRFAAAVDVSSRETTGLTEEVLASARALAHPWGAVLDVISGEGTRSKAASADREELHRLCHQFAIAPQRTHIVQGPPDLSLPAFAGGQSFDALVLGALAHRPFEPALVGTLTSRLLEAVDSDFVLVKPQGFRAPLGKERTRMTSVQSPQA